MPVLNNIQLFFTMAFLLVLLSYYALIFIRRDKPKIVDHFSSISVIMPAHNEEQYIAESIKSVLDSKFDGKKEVIIINDGSTDRTQEIIERFKSKDVKIIKTAHIGKAAAINKALQIAEGELIAIIDADSDIHEDALQELAKEVGRQGVAAACGVVKVKNRNKFVCMWLHIELVYNSFIRSLYTKINANVVTPGALSVYRASVLKEIEGFSTKGFSEDMDVAIRIIRKGYNISFSEDAISETNMPYDPKGFFRQRTRFARGAIDILKRHLRLNKASIDVYTLPLLFFTYAQAIIMGSLTLYKIFSDYWLYFASKGVFLSWYAVKFFIEWFSIVGFLHWTFDVFTGASPLTLLAAIGIASTFLTYPLFVIAIIKYDRKIDLRHIIPIVFMFPFWFLVMIVYTICLPEYFKKDQYNKWEKN